MISDFVAMRLDIEMLKTAFGNSLKVGPVEVIDAKKGYRLRLGGTDDEPFLSPWYPHPETGKTSIPLKKGQVVGVVNPSGDPRQGLMFRGGYSDDNPSPNDNMGANVFEDAGVRVSVAEGALTIEAGGVTFRFSGDGFEQAGGKQTHNGHDVGSTHVHGGVVRGGEYTSVPSN
ncbi:baseplate assembly protein GpV [Rhizobium sp. LC145]|uniref:baseplate assembly protein GpV n=1 Tax=Rhizobium sp. LC145 TaxID=1120688 RepID=UPI00062A06AE|nr:baseplate assembly protein GpV [Rhizobium sp. LC145]KKX24315.1 baseplate assembly protein GpV [Rhizobium sp. LC145]TKT46186.1 baseplate assembly protein [Rhizobiaceae bacterium LC148]